MKECQKWRKPAFVGHDAAAAPPRLRLFVPRSQSSTTLCLQPLQPHFTSRKLPWLSQSPRPTQGEVTGQMRCWSISHSLWRLCSVKVGDVADGMKCPTSEAARKGKGGEAFKCTPPAAREALESADGRQRGDGIVSDC